MAPKVSVIIPAHNEERYILDAVRSVFAQTYPHYDVIVVDDGSTDNTEAILSPYLGSIHYIKQPNQGVSVARNAGIRAATGELIAFLDADDLWLPHHLDQSVALFDQYPDCVLVHGDAYLWADGSPLTFSEEFTYRTRSGNPLPLLTGHGEAALCGFLEHTAILGPPSTWAVRRSLFDEVGLFDETLLFAEDAELCLRILLRGKDLRATPSVSVARRLRPNSMVRTERGPGYIQYMAVLREVGRDPRLTARQRQAVRRALSRYLRWLRWRAMEEALRGQGATGRELLWTVLRAGYRDVRTVLLSAGMTLSSAATVRLARLLTRVRSRFRGLPRGLSDRGAAAAGEGRPNLPDARAAMRSSPALRAAVGESAPAVPERGGSARRLKVGILSAEFFDTTLSRGRGGFGKIARTVASYFRDHPELGIDVLFIHAFRQAPPDRCRAALDGIPLLLRPHTRSRMSSWLAYRRLLTEERIDVLLSIDLAPPFRGALLALAQVPLVVWAHDPRTPEDWAEIDTLRIPGVPHRPSLDRPVDNTFFRLEYGLARWAGRPLRIAAPAEFVARKVPATYGVTPPTIHTLPVFLDVQEVPRVKAARPRVAFLGRLDPIKRPWILWELAKRLPHVEFICLGQAYYPYDRDGGWTPSQPPPNLHLLGHLDDPMRAELLASSWLLVNTSIHEALPMSFLEALVCETPIVSCQDAGGLVSRFGRYVGRFDGDGLQSVPSFVQAIQDLLDDPELRTRLGQEGRQWVLDQYNVQNFLTALTKLLYIMGISWEPLKRFVQDHVPESSQTLAGLG